MYPVKFEYVRAKSIAEAAHLLEQHGDEAVALAGGQSLIPLMKFRLSTPKYVIDISRLSELSELRYGERGLVVGALTRHVQLAESPIVAEHYPIMRDAATDIGDVQVRNLGTIGGDLAQADPAGDWGPVILALNAQINCVGTRQQRTIKAEEFFLDSYTTALEPGELIAQVIIPAAGPNSGGAYMKLGRRSGDFAVAAVALQLELAGDVVKHCGIALGGVGPTAFRALQAERMMVGQNISEGRIKEVAEVIQDAAAPISDARGSADYKRAVLKPLFRKALEIAVKRARREA
ncbi:MAG: xanthine dehydrogenase family protein subunit M [Deltaproteobacteria bacterium]|nr:xanthine dehydrogenase family protein subunit M [Deltaproteobacteria bacterium]